MTTTPTYEGRALPHPGEPVFDHGLGFDLGTLLSRRRAIRLLGIGAGALAADACSTGSVGSDLAVRLDVPLSTTAASVSGYAGLPGGPAGVTGCWFDGGQQSSSWGGHVMSSVVGPAVLESRWEAGDGPPSLAEGVDLLADVEAAFAVRHAAEVELVRSLGVLVRAGVIESIEHLPVEVVLSVRWGCTSAERHMLLDAADILSNMPATTALWADKVLSWSQIRSLVTRLRRFGRPMRAELDQVLGASADVLALADADRFDDLIAEAIADLRAPRHAEAAEDRAATGAFLAARQVDDGTISVYGEVDAPTGATILTALDAQADRDTQQLGDRRHDGRRMTRAQRRGRALARLCADSLAGDVADHNGRPARPLLVVHVPLQAISESAAGRLEVAVPGYLPRVTARTVEALAAEADVRAVIFNGHQPLMVTRKLTADQIPADTRLAVQARDLGARDPGGRTTVGLSDVHHLDGDRTHDPDRMAVVSPAGHHRIIHRHGWTGQIDPDNGQLTWTHPTGRTITTLPWTTRLSPGGPR